MFSLRSRGSILPPFSFRVLSETPQPLIHKLPAHHILVNFLFYLLFSPSKAFLTTIFLSLQVTFWLVHNSLYTDLSHFNLFISNVGRVNYLKKNLVIIIQISKLNEQKISFLDRFLREQDLITMIFSKRTK